MPSPLFDVTQMERSRARAIAQGQIGDHDFLFSRATRDVIDRLHDIRRGFDEALVIAPPLDTALIANLKHSEKIQGSVLFCPAMPHAAAAPLPPQSFDLILRIFDLHRCEDVPKILRETRAALRPNGVFLAAFPGDETLQDLRAALMQAEIEIYGGASPRVHPMITRQQASDLMQRAGFALPVVDGNHVEITYKDLLSLMRDIRGMGEGNALHTRRRMFATRRLFSRAEEIYRASRQDITAHVDMIHAIGWAPEGSNAV